MVKISLSATSKTITKKSWFEQLYKTQNAIRTKSIIAKFIEIEDGEEEAKFYYAITISKKINKRAVKRNLYRRRLKHLLRDINKEQNILQGLAKKNIAINFIARYHIENRKFLDLKKDLLYAIHQIKKNYND